MSVTHCNNPHAGGYNPNSYSSDPEVWKRHVAEAHEETYAGSVLRTGEHNWHDDSDFYAMVWDEETQSVKEVYAGTTRSWAYHDGAHVDATPEARAKAVAWQTERLIAAFTLERLTKIDFGTEVRSLTTRGKNKGVVGVVEQFRDNGFGPGKIVLVKTEANAWGSWIDLSRVEPTKTELTPEELAGVVESAKNRAYSMYGKK